MQETLNNIIDLVVVASLFLPILVKLLQFLSSKTKNQRLKIIESYAIRVVSALNQQANLLPSDKKKEAVKRLSEYLKATGLNFKMTDEDLSDAVESAVSTVKSERKDTQKVVVENQKETVAKTYTLDKATETESE